MPDATVLKMVDGTTLGAEYRAVLRPGELMRDRSRRFRRLPRFFYEIPSWDVALETQLAPHFQLWEFINVDVRETELLRASWPRYIPCAVSLLAAYLELLRQEVGTYVHVAANGGYRSPAHRFSRHASPHLWGTAANIYRIGDDWLDDDRTITRYGKIAEKVLPGIRALPWGHGVGETDDQLHLDLGYTVVVPSDAPGEEEAGPVPGPDVEIAEVGAR
jgi:hypothetical protein